MISEGELNNINKLLDNDRELEKKIKDATDDLIVYGKAIVKDKLNISREDWDKEVLNTFLPVEESSIDSSTGRKENNSDKANITFNSGVTLPISINYNPLSIIK